jgi:hypothetical protein
LRKSFAPTGNSRATVLYCSKEKKKQKLMAEKILFLSFRPEILAKSPYSYYQQSRERLHTHSTSFVHKSFSCPRHKGFFVSFCFAFFETKKSKTKRNERKRIYEFSTFSVAEFSPLLKTSFAKKSALVAFFVTFCFQAFLRIFFFDFDVRFC